MNEKLANLTQKLQDVDRFAIFGAATCASLLVQYCMLNGLADKIVCCAVTEKSFFRHTPPEILGVPVFELRNVEESKDLLWIVASTAGDIAHDRIEWNLITSGYNNIYFMSVEELKGLNETLVDFSADIRNLLRALMVKVDTLSLLVQSMPMVTETHKKSFGKYKDIHKGQTVVVCGNAPSLSKYKYNPNFVHIGTNALLYQDRIKMDYYFHCDFKYRSSKDEEFSYVTYGKEKEVFFERISSMDCVKFLGLRLDSTLYWSYMPFGEFSSEEYNIYYYSPFYSLMGRSFFHDIRYSPLIIGESIVLAALQFALFTNPKRVLIVGCDGFDTEKLEVTHYYDSDSSDKILRPSDRPSDRPFESEVIARRRINERWKNGFSKFKEYAEEDYPRTEIIMVNPVNFTGIYKEVFTDSEGNLELPD